MNKQYPSVVVVRKSLIGVVIFVAVLIILLILYNLYHASYAQRSTQEKGKQRVQVVASQSDVNWYQDQSIHHPTVYQSPPTENQEKIQTNSNTFHSEQRDHVMTEQARQDLLRWMSTPINSNQLTGEQQNSVSKTQSTSSSISNEVPASNDTDQNGQSEKKSFIQAHQQNDSDYLGSYLKDPVSPFELQAGTIIPGLLITGIDSDLPGQIKGQVRSNVYDSIAGSYLLVPQGSTLIGLYDSQVTYGQERVLVVWKRIIFPNGKNIDLEGMPGVDMSGYAGFNDEVDNHYGKIFGSVVLMSVLSAGAQLSQPQTNSNAFAAPTVGQTLAESLGTNIANTGTMITAKNINIQPTLKIRQGYKFNITVTKDIIFPGEYESK